MAIYKSDIVDINLETGSIYRSFVKHSIGTADNAADRFGVRVFRNGEEVDLSGCSCYGYFQNSNGDNIALTSAGTVDGNVAYVTLPQACYNYEGNFCLAIKLLISGVTSTVRIVDGVVDNTNTGSAVAPTSAVPTYSEILSQYDAMVAATAVANGAIATTFNAATVYPAGSYVINSGALYRITADHAANVTWANTSKVATNFGAEVQGLKSAFNTLPDFNVYDHSEITPDYYISSSGVVTENNGWNITDYLPLDKYYEYYYDGITTPGGSPYSAFYDKNKNYISGSAFKQGIGENALTSIPASAKYVRFSIIDADINSFRFYKQLSYRQVIQDANLSRINETFKKLTGYYTKEGSFQTYSNTYGFKMEAVPGEKYLFIGHDFFEAASVAFLKSDDSFLSGVRIGGTSSNAEISYQFTVPKNASFILVQQLARNSGCYLYKINALGAELTSDAVLVNGFTLTDVVEDVADENWEEIELTFTGEHGFYNESGVWTSYPSGTVNIAELEVDGNARLKWSGKTYYDAAQWLFYDDDDNLITAKRISNDNVQYYDQPIDVPTAAVKMILQSPTNGTVVLRQFVGYKSKADKSLVSLLNRKKITVIGDSITAQTWRAQTNWADWITSWTGAEIQNLGVEGTGFANQSPYINRISSIQASPDIIGVALSWNDMAAGLPSGSATDTGTSSLAGYANDFFDALISAYPTVPIIAYCQGPWGSKHPGVTESDSWFAVFTEICALKGIPFYGELYKGSVLRPWMSSTAEGSNRHKYYKSDVTGHTDSIDTVHPNSEGHKVIARYLYPKFTQNIVDVGLDYAIE